MSIWGPREVAKKDAVRRGMVGFALLFSFAAVMVGSALTLTASFGLRQFILPFTLAITGLMVSLPLAWAVIVRELRRRTIGTIHNLDLRGAQSVEMHVTVRDEDIGKDVGFIVFRQGAFAFLGLRSRFAFACQNTTVEQNLSNSNELKVVAAHDQGQTHFLLVPNDRLVFKSGKVLKLIHDFDISNQAARPRDWFDVLPPAGIDPTVEVTEQDLKKFNYLWFAYGLLIVLPVISIAANLVRGEGPLENFTLHAVFGPLSAWWHGFTERKAVKKRFFVHEDIRQGRLALHAPPSDTQPNPQLAHSEPKAHQRPR